MTCSLWGKHELTEEEQEEEEEGSLPSTVPPVSGIGEGGRR